MCPLYFGGSFNPIHLAHLICARAVAEIGGYDRVILVPGAQPPHKRADTSLAAPHHRLEMCCLAVAEDPLFEVSDLEITRPGPSYTIDTARQIRQATGQTVHWLIGADMAAILPYWHESAALLQEVHFVLMARPGWQFDWEALPEPFRALRNRVVPAPLIQISATEIRQRCAAGKPITYLVPPAVERYIRTHGLYAG